MSNRKSRWLIAVGTAFGAIFGLLLILWFWVRLDSVSQSKKSAQLLHDLGKLELGPSQAEAARSIVQRYGGKAMPIMPLHVNKVPYPPNTISSVNPECADKADEAYDVSIRPHLAERVLSKLPILARMGILHDWQVDGAIQLGEGKLLCVSHTVISLSASARSPSAMAYAAVQPHPSWAGEEQTYAVSFEPNSNPHRLGVSVFLGATEAQINKGFELDLTCLTSIRGCRYPCELAPSAWRDYLRSPDWQHIVLGYGKPSDADDPRCAAVAAAH